ncbi:MAG: Rpn family recombination-promoting nuclease/putative transposase [Oscillospiraceae bacterium]|nr:Rpn family recombination-promoting nuclease/putative transposase [Oscillospiraceae bacterium]
MTELEYKFTYDLLFKMIFTKHVKLLKSLVATLINIPLDSIEQFEIRNAEIPPETLGDKFCRLDINMVVNGQRVDLEVQVNDKGDFPERSLYYWAREYSTALQAGDSYLDLPKAIVISIVSFTMFKDYDGFHSEFHALEVSRHTQLTDKFCLHYFELPKLPVENLSKTDRLSLWLALFKAKTEEDLKKIEDLEVDEMQEAISAYKTVTVTPEFQEAARLRKLARHNEASALAHAKREGRQEGIREGLQKGKLENSIENAVRMIKEGLSFDIIKRITNLPDEELRRLYD